MLSSQSEAQNLAHRQEETVQQLTHELQSRRSEVTGLQTSLSTLQQQLENTRQSAAAERRRHNDQLRLVEEERIASINQHKDNQSKLDNCVYSNIQREVSGLRGGKSSTLPLVLLPSERSQSSFRVARRVTNLFMVRHDILWHDMIWCDMNYETYLYYVVLYCIVK